MKIAQTTCVIGQCPPMHAMPLNEAGVDHMTPMGLCGSLFIRDPSPSLLHLQHANECYDL